MAECGSAAASSNDMSAGISSNAFSCGTRVLGEGAPPVGVQVREDLVAGSEPGCLRADRFHDAGDIDAHSMVPWRAHADEQPHEARPRPEAVEVGTVHGRGLDADQHLVVRGNRAFDVRDADDLGRAVALLERGLHRSLLLGSTG